MNLMIDPCCEYETYADALRVGRACDENNYFWYEDPLRDGGVSFYAHKKLKQALKTPLLQGEHLHLVETHTDMAIAEATDFWRADPEYDGGITGTMKIAHAAEGFGMDLELHIAGPAPKDIVWLQLEILIITKWDFYIQSYLIQQIFLCIKMTTATKLTQ